MEPLIWHQESDAYTERAIQAHGIHKLYQGEVEWAEQLKSQLDPFLQPRYCCDIGCGYGAVIHGLSHVYPNTEFIGIDPGEKSIDLATRTLANEQIAFHIGSSDQLPLEEQSVDLVILRMVLQWLPRSRLVKTLAEIDRVLMPSGLIMIQDFLPYRPITSVSHHNPQVHIFKEDYVQFFTVFPWYQEVYRKVSKTEQGEHQQRHISLIRKLSISQAYLTVNPALEKPE